MEEEGCEDGWVGGRGGGPKDMDDFDDGSDGGKGEMKGGSGG